VKAGGGDYLKTESIIMQEHYFKGDADSV